MNQALSETDQVLKTVMGILNKLTPEKFDVLKVRLVNSGINSPDILYDVTSLIFHRAILEPTFCQIYAKLCQYLSTELPRFPSEEPDGSPIVFKRLLLNSCQELFEGADDFRAQIQQLTAPNQEAERCAMEKMVKLRTLGNVRFIGELFNQKMLTDRIIHSCIQHLLGDYAKVPPAEENVEALCLLFNTVGKQLEENPKAHSLIDCYFVLLEEISNSRQYSTSKMRFLVGKILELRGNKWVPSREAIKPRTISEIHSEAEEKLGLKSRNVRLGCGNSSNIRCYVAAVEGSRQRMSRHRRSAQKQEQARGREAQAQKRVWRQVNHSLNNQNG